MLDQLVRDVERGTIRDQARLLGRSVVRGEHHRNDQASPCHATPLTCTISHAGQHGNGSLRRHWLFAGPTGVEDECRGHVAPHGPTGDDLLEALGQQGAKAASGGEGNGVDVREGCERACRAERFGRDSHELLLSGKWEKGPGKATDDHVRSIDAPCVQQLPQLPGVTLDHLRPRVPVLETLSENRIDLDGQVTSPASEPALDLSCERAGTGTQFDHHGLTAFGYRSRDCLGEVARAGCYGSHAARCPHPPPEE